MHRLRLFVPLLAGASLRDRSGAAFGAALGVLVAGLVGLLIARAFPDFPFLIAPIGASAVLVFAVPASPLAQPWPVFGGNIVSGLVAVAIVHTVSNPILAVGLAVGLAIMAMSLLRCLHPPGGAVAITAIMGGKAIVAAGVLYPITLVAANSAALLCIGWLFHRFSGHSYPHQPVPLAAAPAPTGLLREDIDQAVEEIGETFDIDLKDLENLLLRAETIAARRREGTVAEYSI
ncbi:MAG: HPP family protein [Sphingorhabdus sp.]